MARPSRLRLLLSDTDARHVRQWLAPLLDQRRAVREAQRQQQRQRQRRQLLAALWLLVFAVILLTRYL